MRSYFRERSEDVWGALVCMTVGVFIFVESAGYSLGTLRSMGPGFFPAIQGALISVIGMGLLLGAKPNAHGSGSEFGTLRGVLLLTAAFVSFALLIEKAGLVPTVFVTTLLASQCDRRIPLRNGVILAVASAVGCYLVFNLLLGIQIEAFK